MTEFDSSRYERDYLRKLRRHQGPLSDADLLERYAVDLEMDARALAARLDEVRSYWRRRADVPGSIAEVCALLLTADEQLRASAGEAMVDPAWWRRAGTQPDQLAGVDTSGIEPLVSGAEAGQGSPDAAELPHVTPPRAPVTSGGYEEASQGVAARAGSAIPPRADQETDDNDQGSEQQAPDALARRWPMQARQLIRRELLIGDDAPARPRPDAEALVSAYEDGAVVITWRSSPSDRALYRVCRARGPITAPDDGELVAETTDPSVRDTEPDVARPVCYTLFRAGGAGWQPVSSVRTVALPPLRSVRLERGLDSVRVTWSADPAAAFVRVCRTVGAPPSGPDDHVIGDSEAGYFDDERMPATGAVSYGLVPVYRDEDGAEIFGPMAVLTATNDVLESLASVTIAPHGGRGQRARVLVTWPAVLGDALRVYRCDRIPGINPGQVDPDRLDSVGEILTGDTGGDTERRHLTAWVPTGYQMYLPAAVSGGRAFAGHLTGLGIGEPVDRLEVELRAGGLQILWHWPPDVTMADVTVDGGPEPVRARVTRAEYLERGGCFLPTPPTGSSGTVQVVAVSVTKEGELHSPSVSAALPARKPRLRYEIRRGPLWSPGRRSLSVTADAACDGVELNIAAVPGSVMPLEAPAAAVIATAGPLRLAAGESHVVEVRIPSHVRRPYWIICRATPGSGVVMIDPPIAQMKVE